MRSGRAQVKILTNHRVRKRNLKKKILGVGHKGFLTVSSFLDLNLQHLNNNSGLLISYSKLIWSLQLGEYGGSSWVMLSPNWLTERLLFWREVNSEFMSPPVSNGVGVMDSDMRWTFERRDMSKPKSIIFVIILFCNSANLPFPIPLMILINSYQTLWNIILRKYHILLIRFWRNDTRC